MQVENFQTETRWLLAEFKRRKSENNAYSLRSFARQLGLPPGRVSELLSGKRALTDKSFEKIAERLGLSTRQRKALRGEKGATDSYHLLHDDIFDSIAEWQHFAFLNLMDTSDFRNEIPWIAKRLGISTAETRDLIQRLHRLGLIALEGKKLVKPTQNLMTSSDVPSAALRRSHRQSLEQAIASLEDTPLEERDITSMTMAIDPKKIPLAKELIRKFRFDLAVLLETGKRTEVYNLNLQLVPVTKKEKK